jgi:hypothetical protein
MHGSNHTEHYKISCITSHALNTVALKPSVCLDGIHQLLATNNEVSVFQQRKQLLSSTSNSVVSISM